MLKILGLGLSRTGTTSLTAALTQLGYRAEHYCWEKFRRIVLEGSRDFRLFDCTDAVTDIPAAYYHEQLTKVYPALTFIQTIRDVDSWWQSMQIHCERLKRERSGNPAHWTFVRALHTRVYGSPAPDEAIYKRRFVELNERISRVVPANRLLVMDITKGDGWDVLCPFLEKPMLGCAFPHENQKDK